MRTDTPPVVRLEDYRPSDFLVDRVDLDIRLHATQTRVSAALALRPNPAGRPDAPLVLDGDELNILTASLDGRPLDGGAYAASPQSLTVLHPPRRPFTLAIETAIDPTANTKLMGLFRSGGTYCTQCEPEGFRRITYFLDRPDVLAVYRTRIEADRDEAPVLLGNGNLVEAGVVEGANRHYAIWDDPFPKPSYLFAVVGGRLGKVAKPYRTAEGRPVEIAVHVEPGKEGRAAYALDALERSMRWDERVFGRAYDLDVFNVAAVSDFNMGAMENKGLNIFNDKYVLASPETATDGDYAAIEAIVAHEYFHNWTGNRVTCRDWFQLCLKEGLTVFRDQEFSSDERSRPVHRIAEVRTLRARQFTEDAGPLAHPVRPAQYREINNFYTATVYEKGAEVVRMLKTLLGPETFRRGMDLYFERHDGDAATVEDFLACFAQAGGRDLEQFKLWYRQAGTPEIAVTGDYDAGAKTFTLTLEQNVPPTPGQPHKQPMVIPVAMGLLGPNGQEIDLAAEDGAPVEGDVLVLSEQKHTVIFRDVPARPVPSLLRGFSSPVKLRINFEPADLAFLMRHDTDAFNRWQAGQDFATRLLVAGTRGQAVDGEIAAFCEAQGSILSDISLEPAFVAQAMALPGEADIAREIGTEVDPDAIHAARDALRTKVGSALAASLRQAYESAASTSSYTPDAASAGRRSLRTLCLDLLVATGEPQAIALAERQYASADNMTDRVAALGVLSRTQAPGRDAAMSDFRDRFQDDPLVLDKWFALQAASPGRPTLDRVKGLMSDAAFSLSNPNRVRSLVGAFAMGNQTEFNRPDGAGYDFVSEIVLELDGRNPQVASRLLSSFRSWRALEGGRRAHAEAALRRVASVKTLSPDVADIANRCLQ